MQAARYMPLITLPGSSPSVMCQIARPLRRATLFHLSCIGMLMISTMMEAQASPPHFDSVPALEDLMYQALDGWPCVKLLTLDGEVGCSNPGRALVIAPVRRIETANESVPKRSAVLVPAHAFIGFMSAVAASHDLQSKVAGVLLEADPVPDNGTTGGSNSAPAGGNTVSSGTSTYRSVSQFSPVGPYPQLEFAKGAEGGYVWNAGGVDLVRQRFKFPVVLLSENATRTLREQALHNLNRRYSPPLYVVEFDDVMMTTTHETQNSEECLNAGTCLPLGGYSVLSSLPPVTPASPPTPVVLAIASLDSVSFFRDFTPGANTPLSGAIALLAAAAALSRTTAAAASGALPHAILFLFLSGEPWGYLGSRRFLLELDQSGPSVAGIDLNHVTACLEIGPVGLANKSAGPPPQSAGPPPHALSLYLHKGEGQPVSHTDPVLYAVQEAAGVQPPAGVHISVVRSNASNPRLPPVSSLAWFLERNASFPGLFLADFDSAFGDPFYGSHFDDASNVDVGAIAAVAGLVARTLYTLAGGGEEGGPVVDYGLVEALAGCLMRSSPGMACDLVTQLMTPSQEGRANHYVGIITSPMEDPSFADDTVRFTWNFLANQSAASNSSTAPCTGDCDLSGEVCVGWNATAKGRCLFSSTRYVPAYSPRLVFQTGWRLLPLDEGQPPDPDPVWCESFWGTLNLRTYQEDSPALDRGVLVAGVLLTLGAWAVQLAVQGMVQKRLKQA